MAEAMGTRKAWPKVAVKALEMAEAMGTRKAWPKAAVKAE